VYHGLPANIARRFEEIKRVLKPGGLPLASMLSKANGMYHKGTRIAPHTSDLAFVIFVF
jgi:hypothetical protein